MKNQGQIFTLSGTKLSMQKNFCPSRTWQYFKYFPPAIFRTLHPVKIGYMRNLTHSSRLTSLGFCLKRLSTNFLRISHCSKNFDKSIGIYDTYWSCLHIADKWLPETVPPSCEVFCGSVSYKASRLTSTENTKKMLKHKHLWSTGKQSVTDMNFLLEVIKSAKCSEFKNLKIAHVAAFVVADAMSYSSETKSGQKID